MSRMSLKKVLAESDKAVFAPCCYDCASAKVLEMTGFKAMVFSGCEHVMATQGVAEFGFGNLSDLEYAVSRVVQTCTLPLLVDISNGFGGPMSVYRACRRLATLGVSGIMMEDAGDMADEMGLLPREEYYAKVRAAIDALKGTETMFVARSNAHPYKALEEGCERMKACYEMGADMTTIVTIHTLDQAKFVSERVPGWKMFPDVQAIDGIPAVTIDDITPLGFKFMTSHFALKAAMEGMLVHAKENFKDQSVAYTYLNAPGSGHTNSFCPIELYDPQAYLDLEEQYTGVHKKFSSYGYEGNFTFPKQFINTPLKERL